MNRTEKINTVEGLATDSTVGPNGLYTPRIVEGMDPARIAAVLNTYVSRINFDMLLAARRKAYRVAFTFVTIGFVLGALCTYFAVAVWMNPLREVLQHIAPK